MGFKGGGALRRVLRRASKKELARRPKAPCNALGKWDSLCP